MGFHLFIMSNRCLVIRVHFHQVYEIYLLSTLMMFGNQIFLFTVFNLLLIIIDVYLFQYSINTYFYFLSFFRLYLGYLPNFENFKEHLSNRLNF